MQRIAMIHTAPATITVLKPLVAEHMPAIEVMNVMDDSILPQLLSNGNDLSEIKQRFDQYVNIAVAQGASAVICACSSLGPLVETVHPKPPIPVFRIDEAMAEAAIKSGTKIGVVATMETTLTPTTALIERKAAHLGKNVILQPVHVAGAFDRLMAGDTAAHDQLLLEGLQTLEPQVDVVVLAQATMARVVTSLAPVAQAKCLTSPALGIKHIAQTLGDV